MSNKLVRYEFDPDAPPPLTEGQREELARIARTGDGEIDFSDIPDTLDWSSAERGKFYRPIKQQLTLRIDADIIHWFKAHAKGGGYQTRINKALRDYVDAHQRKAG